MKKTAQTLRIVAVAAALAFAGGAHALDMGGGGFIKVATTSDNSKAPPANNAPGMPGHTEGDKEKLPAATTDAKLGDKVENTADNAKQGVTDGALTTKVKTKLLATKDLKSTGIHVKTKDRVVNLTGTVPSKEQHELALSTVRSVEGVTSVNDSLKVSSR
ncbi:MULTISPECIES: BON domain-containing protein [Cupriavidus]|uniref:BON domain-containing protein n=1 Tax=Cupriavidus pauculus TaxID=82633 RepID=A0A5P2HD06_9BURK|nr:BON domain-containing protein [Cupriavidus pauculus]QET05932.1 BON domain-containing protein [Cupriavidus pauculus]